MMGPLEPLSKPGFWQTAQHRLKQLGGVAPQTGLPPDIYDKIGAGLRGFAGGSGEENHQMMPDRRMMMYEQQPYDPEQYGGGQQVGSDILEAIRRLRGPHPPEMY